MPQVMEPDGAHAGVRARGLEAAAELRAVERSPGLRVREDEVIVGAVQRAPRPAIQLAREPIGHGDRAARREVRLPLPGVLAADPGVAHADALRGPVDVAPAQDRKSVV